MPIRLLQAASHRLKPAHRPVVRQLAPIKAGDLGSHCVMRAAGQLVSITPIEVDGHLAGSVVVAVA